MNEVAQLVMPAIRWDPRRGYSGAAAAVEQSLALGVGGYILFGGTVAAARELISELRHRSPVPLLIAADLERGAGQQFDGATLLPPLAALASLGDLEVIRRAARITAREARAIGVNWVLAPVCDLDNEPENPIVGTRGFGGDPVRVAEYAQEWIDACQALGVLACAKHFPGHGRTTSDSHAELPVVTTSAQELHVVDLVPFRAAIDGGVASIMTAHVAYTAFDSSRTPATVSLPVIHTLLRSKLGFHGLVVTDAMIMAGLTQEEGESQAAVRALAAGCDLLLYPHDVAGTVNAIAIAVREGMLGTEPLQLAMARRMRWAEWAAPIERAAESADPTWNDNVVWANDIAERVVHLIRGTAQRIARIIEVIVVEDDADGPYPPPSREPFIAALTASGAEVRRRDVPSGNVGASVIVALFGETRAWKGRAGYSDAALAAVGRACAAASSVILVQFGHPRLARTLQGRTVLCAWGGEAVMQRAAAQWLARGLSH